ncbi:S49 family peptidase [Endozoicomonas elysicola]|uniref:Peptidase S49 n=1 Tax=Endozoicomonas elysicola TaxID=305900 RepID=A0A081KAZ7_9GAMM|nr:S49 family peptidase [Endozoicomonas elysicola]KEI71323.1 peptidase S49 [Endozoicomonas elysicola]
MQDKWRESSSEATSAAEGRIESDRAWGLVESLAKGALLEQRRSRRWSIFFKLLTFCWLFFSVAVIYNATNVNDVSVGAGTGEHTALVDINGQIGGGDVDADTVVTGLRSAFEDPGTKAVILRINSPGGSPVQSGYIYDEIIRLRGMHEDIPLYAVIMDIGASGGYYIAAAADEIYADKASLVGSIGVISSGFGFVGTMEKLGVTRRTYTSGENKAFLDPFQAVDRDAAVQWQQSLDTIHLQFIDAVKTGRGERLVDDSDIFSGMVWSGEQAKQLGLIDGLGSAGYVAREVVGEGEIIDYTSRLSPLEKFARDFGAGVSATLVEALGEGFQLM